MIKKCSYLLTIMVLLFININVIYAASDKTNKVAVDYNGKTLYASISVDVNMSAAGFAGANKLVAGVSAKYDSSSEIFYLSVKRSEINKIFSDSYDNVYSLLQGNIEYYDAKESGEYYLQLDYKSDLCGYSLTKNSSDYYFRNYGYLQLFSATAPLSGTFAKEPSIGGGVIVFDEPLNIENKSEYCRSDFEGKNAVIDLRKTKMLISIVEDEKIDLGDNKNIISSSSDFANPTESEDNLVSVDINNFYAEYDENQKLKYSWTLYDSDGNPIEINYDTSISLDSSSYDKEIKQLFDYDEKKIVDKLKFISFKHEGDLGGNAKVSIYVGDKFKSGSKLNLFYYKKSKNRLEKQNKKDEGYILVDNEGYATFDINHCSEYVLADASLTLKKENINKEVDKDTTNNLNPYIISGLSLVAIIILVSIIILIKKIKKSKRI